MRADRSDRTPVRHLIAARRSLRIEHRRTIDERQAFVAFLDRVDDLPAERRPIESAPGSLLGPTSANGLDSLEEAYEATVMSVPHYADDYDETYEENVAAEFGPEVAVVATEGDWLDDRTRTLVVAAAESAVADRRRYEAQLGRESTSTADAISRLGPIAERLESVADARFAEEDFGALDAFNAQLRRLGDRCDELAADRQAVIRSRD